MTTAFATRFTDVAVAAAGTLVVLSGVCAGMARSFAVLRGASPSGVERATAFGFLLGVTIAGLLLLADISWG